MKQVSELKVGDTAYMMHVNSVRIAYKEVTVTKVTKTQITVDNGISTFRFMKNTGDEYGTCSKTKGWFTQLVAER